MSIKAVIFDIGGVVHTAENIFPYESLAKGFNLEESDILTFLKLLLKKFDQGLIDKDI